MFVDEDENELENENENERPARTFHGFQAIHDHEPVGGPILSVTGEIEYADDCWIASLERMRTDINPRILMLRLAEACLPGGHPVMSRLALTWSEPIATEYDEVHILPGGPVLKVACLD